MIRSMTAFGGARAESTHGSVNIEFRSVNSRYLDINFRLPDDLRMAEGMIRELLAQQVRRGKVEIRLNYTRADDSDDVLLDEDRLARMARQLVAARRVIPDVAAPSLSDIVASSRNQESAGLDGEAWMALCREAACQALSELQANREREGQRLAGMMLECAASIAATVDDVERDLPGVLTDHQQKIATKLRDALLTASPEGFAQISGAELSARIAAEGSLFSMRIDVSEELSRLRSHVAELQHLLTDGGETTSGKKSTGSVGKRLDFLFQEMNREANTLGSKAGALSITHAAINLKLQIEQLREQAQNIE